MSLPLLALGVIGFLAGGYLVYGRLVASRMGLDPSARTPAERRNDGEDFVPTRPFYLLGQHFSAIAAAGPIAGPIIACGMFGWLPCLLWIAFGVVFIGAVHDFTALVASVRHDARSVAEIVRENLGPGAWVAMLAFIWIALVYVIVAFADVTASTFVGATEELAGIGSFNGGGAVAAASVMYLLLAALLGVVQRVLRPPLWLATLLFVPATLGVVWLGTRFSTWLVFPHGTWVVGIMAYCFLASLAPVWVLLQPRGYLGGFVLYLALAVGVVGILFGGYEIRQPATTQVPWAGFSADSLFPFLFVTIACGACSGFHGLVCSGTTSKQVARETHCRPVGYGGMLLEGFVAFIALATVMIVGKEEIAGRGPGKLYGDGIASFLAVVIGKDHLRLAQTFGAMAFSTFVFDTLDVATRLGRYILQELTGARGRIGAALATAATAGVPLAVLLATGAGGYKTFWALFGTSNQLLAALTLLGIVVWLRRSGRPCWFALAPMLFVMTITVWSLIAQALAFLAKSRDAATGALAPANLANGSVALVFLALAAFLVVQAARAVRRPAA